MFYIFVFLRVFIVDSNTILSFSAFCFSFVNTSATDCLETGKICLRNDERDNKLYLLTHSLTHSLTFPTIGVGDGKQGREGGMCSPTCCPPNLEKIFFGQLLCKILAFSGKYHKNSGILILF